MTSIKGIDIAWDRPSIAQIKATGAHWAARYFSPDSSKNLKASEVRDYTAAAVAIVTVFESAAARATQGYAAGVADARLAEAQRRAVGLPDGHIHHFAVDSDVSWSSVQPYFDGAVSVVGLGRVGCYGGLRVIEGAHAHGIRYLWQTVAWSGGVWSPHATIRQPGGTLLGGAADVDYAEVPDFGQYPRPTNPVEPDMPLTDADADKVAARTVEVALGTALAELKDDKNNTRSWAAVEARQENLLRETLALVTAQGKQLAVLQSEVAALTANGLTPEQVAALASALGPQLATILSQRLAS